MKGRLPDRRRETGAVAFTARRATLAEMVPLAVSGVSVIGAVVAGALLLVWILLRVEARDEAAEGEERERQ
jgi:uncharacterized membrane protein